MDSVPVETRKRFLDKVEARLRRIA